MTMTTRAMPKGNVFNEKGVDFSVLPDHVAPEAWALVKPACRDCIIDYYISARDQSGNEKKSYISHVYIEK